jgi:hypothetical protein
MTIQMICPWCQDEASFTIDESEDEMMCESCAMRMAFAPDPAVTYELLYPTAA